MDLNRITRKYVDFTISAALRDGNPTTISGVDVALVAPHKTPTRDTVWVPAAYADDTVTLLLAGPDADPVDGAIVLDLGDVELWARVTDSPEIDVAKIGRIAVT